jgi:tetratricopeptide (TPR) repeat protein
MAKKSRQRKLQDKRPSAVTAGKPAALAGATQKPWQIAVVCLILAVVTAFAFRGVRNNDFLTYDDPGYVQENLNVQQGLNAQSIAWAFTSFEQGNWHPLTWISHIVDWQLYGNHPGGHHLTNLGLHVANSMLLFLLLLYLTGRLGRSAMVAALFALHPAHVESVAWLSERKDLLCAFFWFAASITYAWYVRKPSWKRMAWVAFAFACALMSKPMAVTLPFTLLLLDYWPLCRITFTKETRTEWLPSLWKLCIEKWPLFILSAISSVITYHAQRASGAVFTLQALPLWVRMSNAAISYCRYVRIMIWPNPLIAFYYHERTNIMVSTAILSAIALVLVTAACWHFRKEKPYCLTGWLWFMGTLAPVIGIVQVGDQAMAERYTYLPFIGLFIAIVWLVGDAVANSRKVRIATQVMAVAVIAACALKTEAQVKVWNNSITLFSHVLDVDQRGDYPNSSLGMAYVRQGKMAEAQKYLERALTYDPADTLTLAYSALCLMQTHEQSNLQLAGKRLEFALSFKPDDPDVLTVMALWSSMMGNTKDAESYSRKALAANSDSVTALTARLYLGEALQAQDKLVDAAGQFHQLLALEPDNYLAHNDLGMNFAKQGLSQDAMNEFRRSLAIQPNQAVPHTEIGRILLTDTHQLPQAVEEFNQSLKIDPANADAHNSLGVALAQLGEYDKAVEQFSEALHIDPEFAGAAQNLERAQAQMNSKKDEHVR